MLNLRYEWIGSNIFVNHTGDVCPEDISFYNSHIYGDHRFDDMRMQYIVVDEGVSLSATEVQLEQLFYISRAAAKSGPSSMFVVLVLKSSDSGLQRLLERYVEFSSEFNWVTLLFDSNLKALNWVEGQGFMSKAEFGELKKQVQLCL